MRRVALALLVLTGCAPTSGEPFWALDPIWIEPVDDGIQGVQTWELFAEEWGRRFAQRHYVCSVVVELESTGQATGCDTCDHAWTVDARISDSDCPDDIASDPRFETLTALGLGDTLPDVQAEVPHPEASGAWADYGYGWDVYGWAYPEALDRGEVVDDPTWGGGDPFALWPAFAWEVATSPPGQP